MNLESRPSKKTNVVVASDDSGLDDFEFKPITSGLGFHQPKAADIKPVFTDRAIQVPVIQPLPSAPKKEMNVYQNDLSLFYNQGQAQPLVPPTFPEEEKSEKFYRLASRSQRVLAYILDILLLTSVVGITLTVMARTISMDLIEVWMAYPNEITPLVATIFCGFYIIYFSIFEKAQQSTLGKNILGIRVVDNNHRNQGFSALLLRSLITLLNFVSLGLFAYFDLQNKVTGSKVIRID